MRDKAIVERAMLAIKTGFSQYLATYTHHRLDLRGRRVRHQPLFTIAELQELFEQWVVLHWQQTPHGALRSPFTPGLRLTPNQMYAALVSLRGYRSTALTEQENRKLLPAVWVRVSRKGFQINNRTYNLGRGKLDPCRGSSGITAQQGRWEVHYSPDHPEVAWLFNHRAEPGTDPWVEVPFIHRRLLSDRWTEDAWAEGLRIHLDAGGSRHDEAAIARATAQLLRDLAAGPKATAASIPVPRTAVPARPAPPAPAEPYDDDMPPLDPDSVRPFRSLDRPAGDLFDTSEPARGAGQSLEEFLASLPGLYPSGPADPGPLGDDSARTAPGNTPQADSIPASPPPGSLPGDEPHSAR
ncbi:MAG: hypothetical protein JO362_14820, partial [Streptomycetaceae bacterium]|nr:hypothetical protein [Streptomycetaceae bacterium]